MTHVFSSLYPHVYRAARCTEYTVHFEAQEYEDVDETLDFIITQEYAPHVYRSNFHACVSKFCGSADFESEKVCSFNCDVRAFSDENVEAYSKANGYFFRESVFTLYMYCAARPQTSFDMDYIRCAYR